MVTGVGCRTNNGVMNMSELKQYLDCFFCCSAQVKHLDGCDNGAYVINKDEMKKLLSIHSTEQDKVISELLECLCAIQDNCIGEIAMNYRLDAEQIGFDITKATGMTNPELHSYLAKYKQSKGE